MPARRSAALRFEYAGKDAHFEYLPMRVRDYFVVRDYPRAFHPVRFSASLRGQEASQIRVSFLGEAQLGRMAIHY